MSNPASESTTCSPTGVGASANHREWFRDKVHAHDSQLKSYLRGVFPSVRDVDDVVQESYLRIWKRHAVRPVASVKAFLFTIARHLALDSIRHERRSPINEVTDLSALGVMDERAGVAETACTREEIELLFAAVAQLPPRTREVFLLRKFEGLSQNEIALRLGLSVNTIEAHIGRGTRRCEKLLRERGVISAPRP